MSNKQRVPENCGSCGCFLYYNVMSRRGFNAERHATTGCALCKTVFKQYTPCLQLLKVNLAACIRHLLCAIIALLWLLNATSIFLQIQ